MKLSGTVGGIVGLALALLILRPVRTETQGAPQNPQNGGLPALAAQVATVEAQVATLQSDAATKTEQVVALQSQVSALQSDAGR